MPVPGESVAWPATVRDAGRRFRDGTLPVESLTDHCLRGIAALDLGLNALITVTDDLARRSAAKMADELGRGADRGPLHGIPLVVKDDTDVAGYPATYGSAVFRDRIPSADAFVVARLKAAGAVILGKANMNELAAGGKGGYNPHFGDTANPWSLDHEPGGSSSGTAAAIAAGYCLCGTGTDSGGSVRGPADRCGVVGIRPTFGRVSRTGVFPRCRSFEAVGALGRTVADAALLLNAMAGHDPADPGSLDAPTEDFARKLETGVRGVRMGLVKDYSLARIDPAVAAAVEAAARTFADLGAVVNEIEAPVFSEVLDPVPLSDIIFYEFQDFIGRHFDGADPRDFGDIVRSDMARARATTREAYDRAIAARTRRLSEIGRLFDRVDMLLTPTSARRHQHVDEPLDLSGDHRRFTVPVSYFGLPAVSVPCGFFDAPPLPIGLQIIGNRRAEADILAAAAALERARGPVRHRPPHAWG